MYFKQFCEYLDSIEKVASRNEMTSILVELFSKLNEEEAQIASYLLDGRVAPNFVNSEFAMSEKLLLKAAARLTSDDVVKKREKLGDIGLVFFEIINDGKEELNLQSVFEYLWEIVNTKGMGSVENKLNKTVKLLQMVSSLEAKYISRVVSGTLRLGCSIKTLLDAFSFIISGDKRIRDVLDRAYGVSADIGYIASIVKQENALEKLEKIKPTTGVPILSRLVERAKSFEELHERMGDSYYIQPKFDGLRLQIHRNINGFEDAYKERVWAKYLVKGEQNSLFSKTIDDVKLFTRNLEDVTAMFPEIVDSARKLKCLNCILDGEVIGWDEKKNHFKSYQETMTRKRKYEISSISENIPVKTFVFDCMYLNGEDLINSDTNNRLQKLENLLGNGVENIVRAENLTITNLETLKNEFNRWVDEGLEGLIAKLQVGGYTPGGRNFEWIKLKRSFMSKLNDSVDVVILGYYLGSGKRTKFGIGALLCGIYNEDLDRFESVTKLGTGIADSQWEEIIERLKPLVTKEKPLNIEISKNLLPDVLVYPEVVCTIEADDITKSIKQENEILSAGLSLRFPRLIEFDREKDPYEVTTVKELIEMSK